MDQKRKRIDRPLAIALMKFTPRAAVCGLSPKRMIKKRPSRINNGAPGGWGICSLKQLDTNSPQSQKLPVGSIVMTKTVQAISPTVQPTMLFTRLKFIGIIMKLYEAANIGIPGNDNR